MRLWLLMLGGLLVWATHFLGVYLIASVAEVFGEAGAPEARWSVAGFTAACAAGAAGFCLAGARRLGAAGADPLEGFAASVAALGGGLSVVAIVWQGLPALLGR